MIERGRRSRYLAAMGITEWRSRDAADAVAMDTPATSAQGLQPPAAGELAPPPVSGTVGTEAAAVWSSLQAEVAGCTACALHSGRTQTVFGVGAANAKLMIIGEAPGADEDRQGEPFVGRAGQLLNAMLRGLGYRREDVYIANILKCRPPRNRDPKPEESATCTPFLNRQIELVSPQVLLAVGRIPAQWLLETETTIGRLRGRVHTYGESQTPVIVTYHPAYLLRSPLAKRDAWQDLLMVRSLLASAS